MKRFTVLFVLVVVGLGCSEGPTTTGVLDVEIVSEVPAQASALELELHAEVPGVGPAGQDWEHRWEFGDGVITNEVRPRHTFPTADRYTVTVSVDDGTAKGSAVLEVEPLGVDLVVDNLEMSPLSVMPGDTVIVSASVMNLGVVSSPNAVLAVYVSPDEELDPAAQADGTIGVPPVLAGETYVGATAVTIPEDFEPGSYVVFAQVDSTESVEEFDEANNFRTGGLDVELPEPPPPTPNPSPTGSPTGSPTPTATP